MLDQLNNYNNTSNKLSEVNATIQPVDGNLGIGHWFLANKMRFVTHASAINKLNIFQPETITPME